MGNWNATSGMIHVVNATPPTYTSVTESADPLELGGVETITIYSVSDFSGIQTVRITFEGSNHTMTNVGGGTWRYDTWTPSTVGNYSYTIFIQDAVGNWNATAGVIQVVDTTPPAYTSVTESADPLELGGVETITIYGVTDFSGIQTVQIAFEGSNHTMANLGGGIWRYSIWTPSSVGTYPYIIYIQDNTGYCIIVNGTIRVQRTSPPAFEPFIWLLVGIIAGTVAFAIALYQRLSKKVQPLSSPKTIPPKDLPKKMQSH